jgi:hypothetical protein
MERVDANSLHYITSYIFPHRYEDTSTLTYNSESIKLYILAGRRAINTIPSARNQLF